MNETKLLIGSLSNDLFRVATLTHRGSHIGANKFIIESKRWALQLQDKQLKSYIIKIILEILNMPNNINPIEAEKILMYGILLQNYALHLNDVPPPVIQSEAKDLLSFCHSISFHSRMTK